MTSSLVGSEMCIRDRVRKARYVASAADLRNRPKGQDQLESLREAPGPEPVSYTHLTAADDM
eukprot:11942286-Prorocentrum_lima.AAC.1